MTGPFFSEPRLQPAVSIAPTSQYYPKQTPRAMCALCLPQERPHRPNSALQTSLSYQFMSASQGTAHENTNPSFLMTAWVFFPFPKYPEQKFLFCLRFLYLIHRFIFGMTTAWSNSINLFGSERALHSKCDCWPAPQLPQPALLQHIPAPQQSRISHAWMHYFTLWIHIWHVLQIYGRCCQKGQNNPK